VVEPDEVEGCILKPDDDDDVVKGSLLGYLAGAPGTNSRGRRRRGHACGTEQSPWLVAARRGQRIRFTLMDFSLTTDTLDVDHEEDDVVQSQMASHQDNGLFTLHSFY